MENFSPCIVVIAVLLILLAAGVWMFFKSMKYSLKVAKQMREIHKELGYHQDMLSGKNGSFGRVHGEDAARCIANVRWQLSMWAMELEG